MKAWTLRAPGGPEAFTLEERAQDGAMPAMLQTCKAKMVVLGPKD